MVRAAVLSAMLDLACIADMAGSEAAMDVASKLAATTAIVGIIHFNSFAGRSGEWQCMTKAHVQDQHDKGANHLVCKKHKTAKTYGALAKYVPPGTFSAMLVYMSLPGKVTGLLLEPTSENSAEVMDACMQRIMVAMCCAMGCHDASPWMPHHTNTQFTSVAVHTPYHHHHHSHQPPP